LHFDTLFFVHMPTAHSLWSMAEGDDPGMVEMGAA